MVSRSSIHSQIAIRQQYIEYALRIAVRVGQTPAASSIETMMQKTRKSMMMRTDRKYKIEVDSR